MNRTVTSMVKGLATGAIVGAAIGIAGSRNKTTGFNQIKKRAGKAFSSVSSVVDAIGYIMR